jgi:hypothetical protein
MLVEQEALAEQVQVHHSQEQGLQVQDQEPQVRELQDQELQGQDQELQGHGEVLQLQVQEQAGIQLDKQFEICADHLIHLIKEKDDIIPVPSFFSFYFAWVGITAYHLELDNFTKLVL